MEFLVIIAMKASGSHSFNIKHWKLTS